MIPGSANPLLLKSAAAAGGYQIERSLRFNSSDSGYLSRTPASAGNRKTFTISFWLKRTTLGVNYQSVFGAGASGGNGDLISFANNDTLRFWINGGTSANIVTTQVFRDVSAWYHILYAVDTTQATSSDRIKLYVNGTQVTAVTATYPTQNYDFGSLNTATAHEIGRGYSAQLDGYLADIDFIDGQALTPSSFTEVSATTGQLIPKAYTGSFGTNGFWLKFSDNSAATATTLGKDYSGNGNNWTPNNLSVTAGAGNDSLVDTPTSYGTDDSLGGSVRGNYCTLNPLDYGSRSTSTFANGNLDVSNTNGASADSLYRGTIGVSNGKWYFEIMFTTMYATEAWVGIAKGADSFTLKTSSNPYYNGSLVNYLYRANGNKETNSGSATAYGATWTTNDVIGVALDLDAGTLTFYKNGSSQGSAFTGIAGTWFPCILNGGGNSALVVNFGQRPFAYTAPSGFKALCDTNLPAPVVAKPSTVMDALLYTGNGSARSITGLGFNPDLVWIKSRSAATDHELTDSVRGVTKSLSSNLTAAEATDTGGLTAFNSDGFSLGTNTNYNNNAATYAAWTWDAGSSTVSNTAGSITSSVRANASAGFSIVGWTGTGASATVGHGLGIAPSFLIVKNRSSTNSWVIYHRSLGGAYFLLFDTSAATGSANATWGSSNSDPTSSVFSVGSGAATNSNGSNFIAYCFAPVTGYSSFGSYTGNGSTDGPFVYTGFRPRFILGKVSSTTDGWYIFDAARSPYNVTDKYFAANASAAEATFTFADFLSNGFKLRATTSDWNASGQTYIYAAFAENPFQYARAR